MRVLKRLGLRRVRRGRVPSPRRGGNSPGVVCRDCNGADVAVPVTDPIESREGFARLLEVEGNSVRIVLIDDTSRLVRQLVTQALAILALTARGVRVLTANGDNLTETAIRRAS